MDMRRPSWYFSLYEIYFYFTEHDAGPSMKAPYLATTLIKGLEVLEALSDLEETGLTELAGRLDLPSPTLFRLLATLVEQGYVLKTPASRYRLTLKAWEIGARVAGRLPLRAVARPFLEQLAAKTAETVHLSLREGDGIVIVDKVDSPQAVRVDTYVGQRAPLHCSATGKAFLAFAGVNGASLSRYTDATITDRRALAKELDEVRRLGWAKNRGEWREGVCAAAVPIRDARQAVAAVLSVTVPTPRFSNDALRRRLLPPLKASGAALSAELARSRG
jgi:IclR family KDG regulon transcriptional repressor